MYTLYCQNGTRATAAHMVLAETGLRYELRQIDITANEYRTPEFFAINPRGAIPVLVDDNGATICETIAIMLYLADKHALEHLAPVPTDPLRATLLDWLVYHAAEVQEPVKRSYYAHRYALRANDLEAVREHANDAFQKRWQLVEEHLIQQGPFHLGDRFSVVDIYLLVTSTYSGKLANSEFPAIEECSRRTAERPNIAPILEDHRAGLERIAKLGVPQ